MPQAWTPRTSPASRLSTDGSWTKSPVAHQGLPRHLQEHPAKAWGLLGDLGHGTLVASCYAAAGQGLVNGDRGESQRASASCRPAAAPPRQRSQPRRREPLAQREANESGHGDRAADLLGDPVDRVLDLEVGVDHERLLQQHRLLVELAHPALDDLVDDVVGLAAGARLVGVDRALALQGRGIEPVDADGLRPGRRNVHGQLLAEGGERSGSPDECSPTRTPMVPRPGASAPWT